MGLLAFPLKASSASATGHSRPPVPALQAASGLQCQCFRQLTAAADRQAGNVHIPLHSHTLLHHTPQHDKSQHDKSIVCANPAQRHIRAGARPPARPPPPPLPGSRPMFAYHSFVALSPATHPRGPAAQPCCPTLRWESSVLTAHYLEVAGTIVGVRAVAASWLACPRTSSSSATSTGRMCLCQRPGLTSCCPAYSPCSSSCARKLSRPAGQQQA